MPEPTAKSYLGRWLQAWPGESLIGEVMSVSGDSLICLTLDGIHFTVKLANIIAGRHCVVPREMRNRVRTRGISRGIKLLPKAWAQP